MELSDVEDDTSKIIVEERKEKQAAPASAPAKAESVPKAVPSTAAAGATSVTVTPPAQTPATPPAPKAASAAPVPPAPALALPNLANVDLAKISSILSSLTSVMKNTGVSPASRPSPGTPTSPTALTSGLKTPVMGTPSAPSNPLANILSKVEITPESILSALSKTQTQTAPALQGLSSLLQSVAGNTVQSSEAASQSTSASPANTTVPCVKGRNIPSNTQSFISKSFGYSPNSSTAEVSSTSVNKTPVGHTPGLSSSSFKPPTNSLGFSSSHPTSPSSLLPTETSLGQSSEISKAKLESEPPSPSLEMKIHNFLKGNPGFSGLNLNIPILSSLGSSIATESHASDFQRGPTSTSMDNVDGTPVRDERSGTPTQDEMMDKPTSSNVDTISLLSKIMSPGSSTPSSTRSPLQSRDDGYSQELSNSVHTYRPFGLGRESPAGLYKQSADSMEIPSSLMDSSQEKFYPDTSFQEDEDYRDFDYSGPPPSAMLNLEKKPAKSILKSSKLSEAAEYQPVLSSYGQRSQEFGVKPSFPQSMRSILDQSESCDPLASSPGMYGSYGLRGNDSTSDGSPSPSKNDVFFTPDSNHNNLPKSVVHSGLAQKQYPDSPHSIPHRSLFSSQNALSSPAGRAPAASVEKILGFFHFRPPRPSSSRTCSKTPPASPPREKHFGPISKSSSGEGVSLSGAPNGRAAAAGGALPHRDQGLLVLLGLARQHRGERGPPSKRWVTTTPRAGGCRENPSRPWNPSGFWEKGTEDTGERSPGPIPASPSASGSSSGCGRRRSSGMEPGPGPGAAAPPRGTPISIALPGGRRLPGRALQTTPLQLAAQLGGGLAEGALVARVNGTLQDLDRPPGERRRPGAPSTSRRRRDGRLSGNPAPASWGRWRSSFTGPLSAAPRPPRDGFFCDIHMGDR
ncbi:unnamed protein product [Bubo scandiacus]